VEVKPLKAWMGVHTVRRGPFGYSPSAFVVPQGGWLDMPGDASTVTVLVHGYNVTEAAALNFWFPTMFKRLYWVGQPVFGPQGRAYTTGLAWPGDEVGEFIQSTLLVYPENEFNALRAGVPVAEFIEETLARGGSGDRSVNILAHSLGNMVVNSALGQLSAPPPVPVRYVMSEAAVAAEAFDDDYKSTPYDLTQPQLASHASAYGFSDDARWHEEWQLMLATKDACPPLPTPCPASDYDRWVATLAESDPSLAPPLTYDGRWTQPRGTRRQGWNGYFAGNLSIPNVQVFNTYSPIEDVLRVDLGLPHAWYMLQRYQKPNAGKLATLAALLARVEGAADGRGQQYWALLVGRSSDIDLQRSEYLWATGDHANTIREWLELAHWFPAHSGPAGAQPIARLEGDRNRNMAAFSGDGNGLLSPQTDSHSYLTRGRFADVWEAWKTFRDYFKR
jgi:hypothetical protein